MLSVCIQTHRPLLATAEWPCCSHSARFEVSPVFFGSSLPIRLRTRAPPPVMQEHGAAAGTSREGDHAEVSDVLIGSVEAAKAAWCAATGSSEQPDSHGEVGEGARPRFAEFGGPKLAEARS